jgi:hypothetical protein
MHVRSVQMKCHNDHDRLSISANPALMKELSDAWDDGGPENVNLRGADRATLLTVAAYCVTAAADYQDENGEGRFCWRLHHCGVDVINQLVRKFFRGCDDLEAMDLQNVTVTGTAAAGGWKGGN